MLEQLTETLSTNFSLNTFGILVVLVIVLSSKTITKVEVDKFDPTPPSQDKV